MYFEGKCIYNIQIHFDKGPELTLQRLLWCSLPDRQYHPHCWSTTAESWSNNQVNNKVSCSVFWACPSPLVSNLPGCCCCNNLQLLSIQWRGSVPWWTRELCWSWSSCWTLLQILSWGCLCFCWGRVASLTWECDCPCWDGWLPVWSGNRFISPRDCAADMMIWAYLHIVWTNIVAVIKENLILTNFYHRKSHRKEIAPQNHLTSLLSV